MASSKKKAKKPVAKAKAKAKKPAPKAAKAKAKKPALKPKAKAKPAAKKPAPKAKAKAKPAAKKPAPKPKAPKAPKAAKVPSHGDAWGNASLKHEAEEAAPMPKMTEPSGTPALALHDHEGELVSPVEESEEIAERIHGGEEAVKDEDADDDSGSARLDDREDGED